VLVAAAGRRCVVPAKRVPNATQLRTAQSGRVLGDCGA
jgi:hypothetical protein